jgi:hypothetical protein
MVRTDSEAVVAFYERLGYIDGQVLAVGRRLDGDVPWSELFWSHAVG